MMCTDTEYSIFRYFINLDVICFAGVPGKTSLKRVKTKKVQCNVIFFAVFPIDHKHISLKMSIVGQYIEKY